MPAQWWDTVTTSGDVVLLQIPALHHPFPQGLRALPALPGATFSKSTFHWQHIPCSVFYQPRWDGETQVQRAPSKTFE